MTKFSISSPSFAHRLLNAFAGTALAFSFLYIYESYISVRWAYMGFPYREPRFWEMAYIAVAVSLVSFCLPRKVDRPYTLTLWFLYAIVFVPTLSISFFISPDSQSLIAPLSTLTVVFIALSMSSGKELAAIDAPSSPYGRGLPSATFKYAMLGIWAVMAAVLLYYYRDIISFAGIDDIYYQRAVWKDSGGGLISYVETYFAAVVCPALIAIGLFKGNKLYIIPSLMGFMITYATSAQKSALVMPAIILLVFLSHRYRLASSLSYTSALAGLVVLCAAFLWMFGSGNYAIDLIVVRTLAAPAQTFSQYHTLFSEAGYTWWSNVRGIGLIVPAPDAFAADPNWPRLGYIVGDYLHGGYTSEMNANANLFSGEGVAAAGSFGVVVIAIALALWLRTMDIIARGWNSRYVILIMTPIAFTLTNGHLSTILLSFGGALWMVLLYTMKPVAHRRSSSRASGSGAMSAVRPRPVYPASQAWVPGPTPEEQSR